MLLGGDDSAMMEYQVTEDAVRFDYAANDLLRVRVDFE
jgi:hypothetical protein